MNGQRLTFRINVVSPAHPIEQLTEIPAKALRASVVEACVKSTRRHFAFPLSASFQRGA